MKARTILALHSIASGLDGLTDDHHLTTDPACRDYVAPKPGSRLDRASRGVSCTPCMVRAAFGGCTRPIAGWWCSREIGHDGPCVAREIGGQS